MLVVSFSPAQVSYVQIEPHEINQHDIIHGQHITDPNRWLETPSSKSHKVSNWLDSQQNILSRYRKILKNRKAVYNRLRTYSSTEVKHLIKQGESYYFYQYNSNSDSPALYRQPSLYGNSWMVIDPREFEEKGEAVSIESFQVSPDEKYIAFSLSRAGSDWREIRFKDVKKGKYLDDSITGVKFSDIQWHENGIYYWNYERTDWEQEPVAGFKNQRLNYHKLGTQQEEDELAFDLGETFSYSTFEVTSDQKYLVLHTFEEVEEGWQKVIMVKDLEAKTDFEVLFEFPDYEANFSLIDHKEGRFFLVTDFEANKSRLVSVSLADQSLVEVIPENDQTLEEVNIVDDKIVTFCFREGRYIIDFFNLEGKLLHTEQLDAGYHISKYAGSDNDKQSLYYIRSFYSPKAVYRINTEEHRLERLSKSDRKSNEDLFETIYVKYLSNDGMEVPMYLTYKKGTDLSAGNNPVLLYAYGAFGVSLKPHYDEGYILFMNSGGILATPLIRGGGDFGNEWHDAGRLLNKQQSFDDFIAATEYLIQTGVTNPEKIAINGRSNGGLLVGAVMTQRPELFKVAVPEMGLFDMLRYNQFGDSQLYYHEYGTPEDSTQFINLQKYSPYHNICPGNQYPATLVIAAENDGRTPAIHSYKFVSQLQTTSDETPFLLYLEKNAGHDGPATLKEHFSTQAFKWSFILHQLGMKLHRP